MTVGHRLEISGAGVPKSPIGKQLETNMFGYRKRQLTAIHAITLCVLLGGTASLACADVEHDPVIVRADKVEWKPAPPILPGVEMAVLQGSPNEAGPFIMRLKFPAFFEYPVHRHRGTEGYVTVLSGAIGVALGETFDPYVARPLPAGSYFVTPDAWHFAWTFEETVVEIHGNGPWRVEFLDPRR
jgi:ChrR Cupin-like domain